MMWFFKKYYNLVKVEVQTSQWHSKHLNPSVCSKKCKLNCYIRLRSCDNAILLPMAIATSVILTVNLPRPAPAKLPPAARI